MTFSDAKDQIAKRIGYDSMDEMFKLLGGNTLREAKHSQFFHVINEAANLYAEEKAREAFEAAREQIKHPDWDYVYEDFEAWKKVCRLPLGSY